MSVVGLVQREKSICSNRATVVEAPCETNVRCCEIT